MLRLKNRVAGLYEAKPQISRWPNTVLGFGLRAQLYHAIMALAILVMLAVGLTMENWPQNWCGVAYTGHKGLGLWILLGGVIWFLHYLFQPTPAPLPSQPRHAYRLAKLVHRILLLLCIVMPLSGWVMVSARSGKPVSMAPGLQVPPIAAQDPSFGYAMQGVHIVLAWALIGLIALHGAAALYHHFIKRDSILKRMIPGFRLPTTHYRSQFDKGVARTKKLR